MVYGLPVSAVVISLTDYIPAVALLFAVVLYITDCVISLNPKYNGGKPRFSLFRIICGATVVFMVLGVIFNDSSVSPLLLLPVSVILPLIVEFLLKGRSLKAVREKSKTAIGTVSEALRKTGFFTSISSGPC